MPVLRLGPRCRCVGTFSNYLTYLRSACLALDIEAPPINDPVFRRAKAAIVKRLVFSPRCVCECKLLARTRAVVAWRVCRPRMFIQRETVLNMVLAVGRGWEELTFAMLWATAYIFLLRVPSEGLPLRRGGDGYTPVNNEQSLLFLEGDNALCLRLGTRKNQLRGGTLRYSFPAMPVAVNHANSCQGGHATVVAAAAHYVPFMGCGTDSFHICHREPSRGAAFRPSSCGHD